jgi:hypothetical protein
MKIHCMQELCITCYKVTLAKLLEKGKFYADLIIRKKKL